MEHYPYQGNSIIDYPMFDGTQGFLMFDGFFSLQPTSVAAELERRRLVGGVSRVYRTAMAMSLSIRWLACDVSNALAVG